MEQDIKVEKIVIKVKDITLELTLGELRLLQTVIRDILSNGQIYYPVNSSITIAPTGTNQYNYP